MLSLFNRVPIRSTFRRRRLMARCCRGRGGQPRADPCSHRLWHRARILRGIALGRLGRVCYHLQIGTGLYLVVIAMIASSLGGYIAGRLRSRWIGVHSDEVYFRDTAHGFIAWAFALCRSPADGDAATSVIGGAASGASPGRRPLPASPVRWTAMSTRCSARTRRAAPTPAMRRIRVANVLLFTSSFGSGSDLKPADPVCRQGRGRAHRPQPAPCRKARQ